MMRLLGRAVGLLGRPRSLAFLGGSALALAFGVVALPWLFPASVFRSVSAVVAAPAVVVLFGLLAGLLGVRAVRETATGEADRERWTPTPAPERAYYEEYRTAGRAIDSVLGADREEAAKFDARRRDARGRIREAAVSVVGADEGIDRETAAERIAAGTWTDDPRAAAFLGGRDLAPLGVRIRDWASGRRFERWATRAVAEIEARAGGGRSAESDRTGSRPAETEQTNPALGESELGGRS